MCGNGGVYLFFCIVQIIKTFAVPKLMFRASVIPLPNDLEKEVNSIFYNSIWNGKDN